MKSSPQRGLGLVEALVALLVLGLGLLTFVALQVKLRLGADLASQRTQALLLAQADLESLRHLPHLAAYDALGPALVTAGSAGSVAYRVQRGVSTVPGLPASAPATLRDVSVSVSWSDRAGQSHAVALRTQLARADPALPATLGLRPPRGSASLLRTARVPVDATDLGDGTSVFKPVAAGSIAYVLDNLTGAVVRRCVGVAGSIAGDVPGVAGPGAVAALSAPGVRCDVVQAWLVSGFVRADGGKLPDAQSPQGPLPGPFALRIDLDNTPPPPGARGLVAQLSASYWPVIDGASGRTIGRGAAVYAPAECAVDAASAKAPQALAYACLVPGIDLDGNAATPPAFHARLTLWPLEGWFLGTTPDAWRVCRYGADLDHDGAVFVADGDRVASIDNDEHPYAWLDTARSLSHQNFLLVRGDRACPAAGKPGQAGHYTDATTVPHQP